MAEKLLTKKDVADRLNVSTRTIGRYVKIGWLQPIRISEQILRFDPAELDRFLRDGTKKPLWQSERTAKSPFNAK